MFEPLRSPYRASWTKWISGGAFGDSSGFRTGYRAIGPEGIATPEVPGLGPWGYAGDID